MVLEYLPFRYMVNCMRVSKGWREYLSKLPRLWMHLDLSGARKPVPRSFVNMAFKRSKQRMSRATIHRFEHMDVLKNLAKAAKELTELQLVSLPHTMSTTLIDIVSCAPGLKKLVLHPEITLGTAMQILQTRPALKHVTFNAMKRSNYHAEWAGPFEELTTLAMHFTEIIPTTAVDVKALLSKTPSLRSLSLTNLKSFIPGGGWPDDLLQLPPMTSMVLQRITVIGHTSYPIFPPTLQELVVELDGSYDIGQSSPTRLLQSHLPELTHLTLSNCAWTAGRLEQLLDLYLDDSQTVRSLENAKPLTHLSVRGLVLSDPSFFKGPDSLFGRSPRILTKALETLDVTTLTVDDDEIEYLLTYDLELQSIDLSQTNITGASIKMLADKLPMLTTIKADNCTRINGRDAIHYAQRKGIAVSCQMVEQKGGKRIRYG
jgi:F-box/TPR repeat protein Pof3